MDSNRQYPQVLYEYNNNDSILVSYYYGDDLISQKRGSEMYYYHYDRQMSTRHLTDASQNITDGYTYDAFGILLNRFGGTENNYLYTGEQFDPNIGFYYLRARYLNPETGRFLTMDTWNGNVFEPLSLHKYLYCECNPVNSWDPSGEFTLIEFGNVLMMQISLLKTWVVSAILHSGYVACADKLQPVIFNASNSRAFAILAVTCYSDQSPAVGELISTNRRVIGLSFQLLGSLMQAYHLIHELIDCAIYLGEAVSTIKEAEQLGWILATAADYATITSDKIYNL